MELPVGLWGSSQVSGDATKIVHCVKRGIEGGGARL